MLFSTQSKSIANSVLESLTKDESKIKLQLLLIINYVFNNQIKLLLQYSFDTHIKGYVKLENVKTMQISRYYDEHLSHSGDVRVQC